MPLSSTSRARNAVFWTLTIIVVAETVAGSLWDLLRIAYVRDVVDHLGYPLYLLTILGAWKLPGAVVILAPGFPRLKEWAYAGVFFEYSGAAASHLLVHDRAAIWLGPLVFAAITLASSALRPPERSSKAAGRPNRVRQYWMWTILAVVGLVAVSLLTLPKGGWQG